MVFSLFLFLLRIGSPLLGILIPGLILMLSVFLTWILYRHFSGKRD